MWVIFYEKFWFISKLGLQTLGHFWKMGGCQIAKRRLIWKIKNILNLKFKFIGGLFATESQSHRVTDTQGYSVYGWVKFFVPDFNKLPYSLRSQGDNSPPRFCESKIILSVLQINWLSSKIKAKRVEQSILFENFSFSF